MSVNWTVTGGACDNLSCAQSGRDKLSWCDKLAATPGIGFRLDPHFIASDAIVNALTPRFNKWAAELKGADRMLDKAPITVVRQESFAFAFQRDNGVQFGIDANKASVEFTHRMRLKAVSGGPPVGEMLSTPLPYTALLPQLAKDLVDLVLLLPSSPDRKVRRIGVIASANVEPDVAPPGVKRFLDYVGKPWKRLIDGYRFEVTGIIEENSTHSDRCIHTLTHVEGGDLLALKFDWQRTFAKGQLMTEDGLQKSSEAAQKSALEYFEDLAVGNRFDAELIEHS